MIFYMLQLSTEDSSRRILSCRDPCGFVHAKRPPLYLERQPRLYEHVARLPVEDPVHRILSCRDPRGWTMPMGVHRLHGCVRWRTIWRILTWRAGVCLGDGQTEAYLKDIIMMGLASVWAMARWRPIWEIWAWQVWRLPRFKSSPSDVKNSE